MKYNLDKNEKFLKSMEPKAYDYILFLLSLVGGALGVDLGFELFTNVCGAIFFYYCIYALVWFTHCIIHLIIKIKNQKKEAPKEVINEDK